MFDIYKLLLKDRKNEKTFAFYGNQWNLKSHSDCDVALSARCKGALQNVFGKCSLYLARKGVVEHQLYDSIS